MDKGQLTFLPVNLQRITDLERLFESRGGPHYCWCTAWRPMPDDLDRRVKEDRKSCLIQNVTNDVPIGLLAYLTGEPIGWCSVGPKASFRALGGDMTHESVWSIVCFFVRREYRSQGLGELLLQAAIRYAKEEGAEILEAYPVDRDAPSYRFMGSKPMFERAGFEFIKMAGKWRHVMTIRSFGCAN